VRFDAKAPSCSYELLRLRSTIATLGVRNTINSAFALKRSVLGAPEMNGSLTAPVHRWVFANANACYFILVLLLLRFAGALDLRVPCIACET